MLFGYERLTGVLDVIVVEAAVEAAGRLVSVKTVFQITRVAVGGEEKKYMNVSWESLQVAHRTTLPPPDILAIW